MSTAEEAQADEARAAVTSDIQEIKAVGAVAAAEARAKLPWILGAASGLVAIGILITARSRKRAFGARRRTLLGSALRAAALSGVGLATRRWIERVVDRALPEPQSRPPELSSASAPPSAAEPSEA